MRYLFKCSAALVLLVCIATKAFGEASLSLDQAIVLAQKNDPWISGSHFREQASDARSVSARTLPDPRISLGFANLPVDTFDFGQEPMTQLRIGVSQMFPRGDTRELQSKKFRELSLEQPYRRQDRLAQVAASVSRLWLEVYRHREAIRLIEQDRALFEHLVDVAESSYTSAFGRIRQQDLVRAQLELTRLEDRLTVLQQQQDMSRAKLDEWLVGSSNYNFTLSNELPVLGEKNKLLLGAGNVHLIPRLNIHPAIKAIDQQVTAATTDVQLAKQKYKSQWGINASYGYRDDDPAGNERSDFFSAGVTFDVPLFTSNRQDKDVEAAFASTEALKTDKALALRAMRARLESLLAHLKRLDERKSLYEERLLNEIHDQAEAALNAYTNDAGDFAEVVRARIAELNANIDFLNINIDRLQTVAEINYFLAPVGEDTIGGMGHE